MASGLLLVAIASAAVTLLCAVVVAGQDDDKIMRQAWPPSCSSADNYTAGSQYKKNLDQLLAALPATAGGNGWFYNGTVESKGDAADDQVSGLIMCYADYNATACRDCLAGASAGITRVCPDSRNASALYDACVLRYYSSAPTIPAVADRSIPYHVRAIVPWVPVAKEGLRAAWKPLMSKLVTGVAASPLRLANGTAPYSISLEMYGLAQCKRDLDGAVCDKCVRKYVSQLGDLFPNNTGGAIKGYSCYLRYQVDEIDITLPPLQMYVFQDRACDRFVYWRSCVFDHHSGLFDMAPSSPVSLIRV